MSETSPGSTGAGMGATMEMMRATGDLIKSLARFSWALSVYTAGQAGSMLMPGSQSLSNRAGAMKEIADAAGSQLSGPVRTAYSIGTNLSSGVIDFAFSTAGFGPKGQAPSGSTSGLSVPMMTGGTRRVAGVRTVSSGALHRPVAQEELVEMLSNYQREAATNPSDLQSIVIGLWKSEGLSTTVGKYPNDNSFSDARLPRAALPIAHVGFGSGSTEALVFNSQGLKALFAARCAREYQDFSFEGIGAILRIYERGFFKVMSGALGLIRLDAPDGPDPTNFFAGYLAQYPAEIQRLIAHGYGRIIAFSNMNIYSALQEITTLPPERIEGAAHGAGFAFAIMNGADLPRMLNESAVPFDPQVRTAFQNGLVYSLVFFDWYVPGLLKSWQPSGALETELVELARSEAALTRTRGYPLAFRLQHPLG